MLRLTVKNSWEAGGYRFNHCTDWAADPRGEAVIVDLADDGLSAGLRLNSTSWTAKQRAFPTEPHFANPSSPLLHQQSSVRYVRYPSNIAF